MAMTWEELVAEVTARHPMKESKMFGMPCLKRENGKVVAGHWKDGGLTVKLVDEVQREAALALAGAQLFDPGMGRVMREWVHVPADQSGEWERLVEQAIGGDVAESDTPIVLMPGEGEVIVNQESWSSRIKVARDELLLTESSYAAGERGARPHFHREHADGFYVLDGELAFNVAGERRLLPAGAFVLAPRGLVHGFEVDPGGGRHLNLHAPGHAFAKLTRARRDGVEVDPGKDGDTFAPPADGGRPVSDAVIRFSDEGERMPPTARFLLKAALPELAVLEFDVEPEFGGSSHVHKRHHDEYYVLAGEIEFGVGGETLRGAEGTFVSVPPGVEHVWTNTGPNRARFLNIHAPGTWFEQYLRERAEIELAGGEPDRAFFERHDTFVSD